MDSPATEEKPKQSVLRGRLHEIIFEADTPAGKWFDVWLLIFILGSVAVVVMESVKDLDFNYHRMFVIMEWVFTITFTIEYLLRLYSVVKPWRYALSFYGIVDVLAILPTYLSLFIVGSKYLLTIRALRLLRLFRIFKLVRYLDESRVIARSLKASAPKLTVFLIAVLTAVLIIGSAMYVIEGSEPGSAYTSIPRSMYWAIVTVTTVGFGDITPQTAIGQFLSAILMLIGYAIIAVPTGIVSSEMSRTPKREKISRQACPVCAREGHEWDAVHCKFCGADLHMHDR